MISYNYSNKPIIIRKSPIIIVKNFLIFQIIAVLLYVGAGFIGHYAQIYRSVQLNQFLSFQIAQAVFIFLTETAIVCLVFLRWHREYLLIKRGQLIHGRGVIYQKQTSLSMDEISAVNYRQGPMGRLAKYGNVVVSYEPRQVLKFSGVPDPHEVSQLIIHFSGHLYEPEKIKDLTELISSDEHEALEFKSSFRWDLKSNRINKNLEKVVMKTVSAFLNSKGGQLVLGVDDQKNVLGMDHDFKTLGKSDADGFENHFSHIFNNMIGAEHRQFVKLAWVSHNDKNCCVVTVMPSLRPVYLKSDDNEEFYIRTGNGTTSLKLSEANSYIKTRFA